MVMDWEMCVISVEKFLQKQCFVCPVLENMNLMTKISSTQCRHNRVLSFLKHKQAQYYCPVSCFRHKKPTKEEIQDTLGKITRTTRRSIIDKKIRELDDADI